MDDEFLTNAAFWPPSVDLRPVIHAYATMMMCRRDYWENCFNGGMVWTAHPSCVCLLNSV